MYSEQRSYTNKALKVCSSLSGGRAIIAGEPGKRTFPLRLFYFSKAEVET